MRHLDVCIKYGQVNLITVTTRLLQRLKDCIFSSATCFNLQVVHTEAHTDQKHIKEDRLFHAVFLNMILIIMSPRMTYL